MSSLHNRMIEGGYLGAPRAEINSTTWSASGSAIADGAGITSSDIVMPGVALGDFILVSCSVDLVGMTVTAYVKAANTVVIRIQNESGGSQTLSSPVFYLRALKKG